MAVGIIAPGVPMPVHKVIDNPDLSIGQLMLFDSRLVEFYSFCE